MAELVQRCQPAAQPAVGGATLGGLFGATVGGAALGVLFGAAVGGVTLGVAASSSEEEETSVVPAESAGDDTDDDPSNSDNFTELLFNALCQAEPSLNSLSHPATVINLGIAQHNLPDDWDRAADEDERDSLHIPANVGPVALRAACDAGFATPSARQIFASGRT
eukprot:COSAG05_NODE_696_length_7879_cov_9.218895_1_plen_165_part_00